MPLHGPAILKGRNIEEFVLLRTIHVNHPFLTRSENGEFWILPGQFIPVSEDARGYYFQATNGLHSFFSQNKAVAGGLYVSKQKPDRIFRYFGDATDSTAGLDIDGTPLLTRDVKLLKVAHSEKQK
ncbi:MAG: hypothetical protein ABI233_09060 [Chthoniobacterales bacterium]